MRLTVCSREVCIAIVIGFKNNTNVIIIVRRVQGNGVFIIVLLLFIDKKNLKI